MPSFSSSAITTEPVSSDMSRMTGLETPSSQDQRLRNQRVGRIWSSAGSGPVLRAVMRTKTSSDAALAYSAVICQYPSPSNAPLSRSSNSGCSRVRFAFSCLRRS